MKKIYLLIFIFSYVLTFSMFSQYQLVWEEDFDGTVLNTDRWNVETNVGVWNTGANQELEHYRAENVEVGPDGEGGNALILTAKKEDYNGYHFTSGKITSAGKIAAKYGKIEARIKLPVLADGLWPAFWMLGSQGGTWPACGEIDILEAGNSAGIANGTQEWTFNGALHWEYQDSNADYGYQHTEPESESLYQYNTYTMVWSPARIEMYFNDNTEPYYAMNLDGEDIEEFHDWAHYFILNLAVGGSFPGITNPDNITAPMPAKMYVDYIKVYQQEGEGEMVITPPASPVSDYYGLFTENTAISEKFVIDDMGNTLQIWENTLYPLENAPSYDGSDVMAFFAPQSATWYGFGLNSTAGVDLRHYANGYLHFAMRTSSDLDFWVGVGSMDGSEAKINFTDGSDPYGFARDDQWHTVTIPVSELTGQGLDLSSVGNIFMLGGTGATTNILVDDVYYSVSETPLSNSALNPNRNDAVQLPSFKLEADYYGIFTENSNITTNFLIDDVDGHIYIWENTLSATTTDAYDGEEVMSFSSTGVGWWGFGVTDDMAHDLTYFANGALSFSVKTTSSQNFSVNVYGANDTQGSVLFSEGSDPDGFTRDGEWHRVIVPISDLVNQGLDLSAVSIPFGATGGVIVNIAFDDIIYTAGTDQPENPDVNENSGETPDGITSENYGIFTERASITENFDIDEENGFLYLWSNLEEMTGQSPYEGNELLAFSSPGDGWSGFGIFSQAPLDLSHYESGYLNFSMKIPSESDQTFTVLVEDKESGKGEIVFAPGSDPYGVQRDGEWHFVSVPVSDLLNQTSPLNLSILGNIFAVSSGSPTSGYFFDDIYFSEEKLTAADNVPEYQSNVEMFPNPAGEKFTLSVREDISSVKVIDLTGKVLKIISDKNGTLQMTIDCSSWNEGIYLLQIVYVDGHQSTHKIMVR